MAKRNCIGILYSYDSNWIGGSYYIQNLIMALQSLPDEEKPSLKIICRKPEDFDSVKALSYPYAKIFTLKYGLTKRIINKLTAIISGIGWIDRYYLNDIRIIFPASFLMNFPPYFKGKIDAFKHIKKVFWIPDFQERYYPEFFEAADIERRDKLYREISVSDNALVLSSYSGFEDFKRFYAPYTCKVNVVHFAVTHPSLNFKGYETIQRKYQIPDHFYFIPNQFWKHKNHMVVLKAMLKLKQAGKNILVVFSGKESDYRNPEYFPSIKKFVSENGLAEQCHFLGFIPREDQLLIMKKAAAVIQPSLFEGWSTVVEDAKSLGVFVIASDITTHREQIKYNGTFFNATDEGDLVNKIVYAEELPSSSDKSKSDQYSLNVSKFAKDFTAILK
jgi:glycosyltransferase involved in cell wall biosynthesis